MEVLVIRGDTVVFRSTVTVQIGDAQKQKDIEVSLCHPFAPVVANVRAAIIGEKMPRATAKNVLDDISDFRREADEICAHHGVLHSVKGQV